MIWSMPRNTLIAWTLFGVLAVSVNAATGSVGGLRVFAERRGLLIGGAMRLYPDTLSDPRYLPTFSHEFNFVVPEHVMKFENTHPLPGVYDFLRGDFVVRFAREHDMKVRGHTLAWHEANPDWVTRRKFSPEAMRLLLQEHIATVAGHFRGQVLSWDVVNEAFDDKGRIQNRGPWPWIDHARGRVLRDGDYLRDAFQWAHDADPQALLFYNDYGAEELNPKSDGIYQFIRKKREEGVPIQGIGFQMHIDTGSGVSEESLRANFKRFGELGLIIHVTEMDVGLPNGKGSDPVFLKRQAEEYAKVMRVCLETPQCQAFLTWGLTDKYNWIDEGGQLTSPLLLDAFYNPKPAYEAVRELLR